jgi:hypothetical protein
MRISSGVARLANAASIDDMLWEYGHPLRSKRSVGLGWLYPDSAEIRKKQLANRG